MQNRRAIIFDVDGTLSDPTHRLHLLPNHQKFLDECHNDPLHEEVALLNEMVHNYKYSQDPRVDIFVVSGRSDSHKQQTIDWLNKHSIQYDEIYMRPDGDYRPDTVIKKQILEYIRNTHDVIFTVDDRQKVVDMWREEGIPCFQVRAWSEKPKYAYGKLVLMVGPSGAGKSKYLSDNVNENIVVSSDSIREQLCGDFKDQTRNTQVFVALHAIVKARLENGLNTVVDATNIRTKDRVALVDILPNLDVTYIVIDRPLADKRRDGGWRNEIPKLDLIGKHDQTFKSNLKEILNGDGRPNVTVVDERTK